MAQFVALFVAFVCFGGEALAGYEVSTFRQEDRLGKNYWNAASALDNNMETAWRIHGEASNEGSWIAIDTPTSEIDKIAVVNGWAKSDEVFRDHARIKTARVEIFNQGSGGNHELLAETTISFEDTMDWQIIDLPDTKVGGELYGGRVRLTVTEVYPGVDFPNLAVSEVRVHLKEFPAATLAYNAVPNSEQDSHTGDLMMDGNKRTFWAATADAATFSVRASGYGLSSLGIQSGPRSHGRPKTVKLIANQAEVTHTLEDRPGEMQWLLLPCLVGYTGGSWGTVQVEIIDTYPGDQPGVAIIELKMNAGSIEEF